MDIGTKALKRLGKRIRKFRENKKLSQEAFADEVNLARSYISGVERGKRNLSFKALVRIAKCLEITLSELCEGIS